MSDQNPWVEPVGPGGNQGSQTPGNAFGQSAGQAIPGQGMPNQGMQGQMGHDPIDMPLDKARQFAEGQIHQAIDQYAGRLPGGSLIADQIKRAASGLLDGLERQADTQVDSRLGNLPGMGGKYDPNQGGQGNQGGQF
ncbi:MAG: hypothetical protein H0W02_17605 [Ktedonobacteraceae bacterium]|nr:hypothetical protein [Ktedonobacteraceae bacterium]